MRDVHRIVRPLFVYAGANDPRVARSESDAIVKAVRTRGVPVEYMVAVNEGHSIDRRENKIELITRTARFLEDALVRSRPPLTASYDTLAAVAASRAGRDDRLASLEGH
jgi:dipeptidyl aminopeptidase/acylaminoacyl peptidase